MRWVMVVGWVLVIIGSLLDPTETGLSVMNLGIVLVLLALMVTKQEKPLR